MTLWVSRLTFLGVYRVGSWELFQLLTFPWNNPVGVGSYMSRGSFLISPLTTVFVCLRPSATYKNIGQFRVSSKEGSVELRSTDTKVTTSDPDLQTGKIVPVSTTMDEPVIT